MAHDMVFNSVVFLFCFMPLALLLYYLAPGRAKNAVLLLESVLFYCWAGITWLPLIAVLVLVNYLAGLFLGRRQAGGRRLVLVLAVAVSAAALVFFKYTNFLIDTLNQIAGLGLSSLTFLSVLPLGIQDRAGAQPDQLCRLRCLFPAADRRADRALP